jgi:hypothetical protein
MWKDECGPDRSERPFGQSVPVDTALRSAHHVLPKFDKLGPSLELFREICVTQDGIPVISQRMEALLVIQSILSSGIENV